MRLALVAAVVILLVSVEVARRYRQSLKVTPYALVTRTPEENAVEGQRLGLTPVQAGPLRALVRTPATGGAWFVYWGGNTENYFREAVDALALLALPPEVGLLVVAPSGFDSPGHPRPGQLERDALAVRRWLEAQHHPQQLVLGGYSMGAFSAVAAAAPGADGLVLLGVAREFVTGDRGPLVHLRDPVIYRLPELPPKVRGLVVQGALDEPGEGQAVARWLGAPLEELKGVPHEATLRDPGCTSALGAFIRAGLRVP